MDTQKTFSPDPNFSSKAHVKSMKEYQRRYHESISDPEKFWGSIASNLKWTQKWSKVMSFDFEKAHIRWFEGGKLNVSVNCLDVHVEGGHGEDIALIWEGNDVSESREYTYAQLLEEVQKMGNVLKKRGIQKGDRVCLYLQMIPELPIAMLACARIGAIHSVVFGAFSPNALRDRICDSQCKILITQDTGVRGLKTDIPMKTNADLALEECPSIEKVLVVKRTRKTVPMTPDRDLDWADEMGSVSNLCKPEEMDAEDPLFILYTSGSTGKPKGVVHTTGGYLVYTSFTFEQVFDYRPGDRYWCTADCGWITGHSYLVYGPLANRATSLMFEGVPNYPDFGRFWSIIEKHRINIFYTAPTAIRALMKEGDRWPLEHDLSSLRLLGSVGEPIKEPEWLWYHSLIGGGRCPIVDTWWQTETGGIMITPLPGVTSLKPGSASHPFFGVQAVLLDESGHELEGAATGILAIKSAWPGMLRTLYGDHKRFQETYFGRFPEYYLAGDSAKRDEEGYFWITGRIDDVLNVSGHRVGTAEVEGAIGKTSGVAEAAVVGYPHEIKGQGIYAFVTLMTGEPPSPDIRKAILATVRTHLGPHTTPDKIQFTPSLPKTRSGKIMRRILRKIASGNLDDLGDTSTLADPSVVTDLASGKI